MNASTVTGDIGTLGYGIGVAIVLLLITVIASVTYFCTRTTIPRSLIPTTNPTPLPLHDPPDGNFELGEGIDEATLTSYPKLLYSEAKANYRDNDSAATCCSVCLADYNSDDVLRLLPECGHIFHLRCVDQWLRRHPTCPICRTSPMPTPLAEVVPLARVPM